MGLTWVLSLYAVCNDQSNFFLLYFLLPIKWCTAILSLNIEWVLHSACTCQRSDIIQLFAIYHFSSLFSDSRVVYFGSLRCLTAAFSISFTMYAACLPESCWLHPLGLIFLLSFRCNSYPSVLDFYFEWPILKCHFNLICYANISTNHLLTYQSMCNKSRYLLAYKISYAKLHSSAFQWWSGIVAAHEETSALFHMSGSDIPLEYVGFLVAGVI